MIFLEGNDYNGADISNYLEVTYVWSELTR